MKNEALQITHHSKLIRMGSLLQRLYFKPTFLGEEHIQPLKPAMYVGNHTIYGILDAPVLIDYLFTEHKIAIVSLGDHVHFKLPVWRSMVKGMGAVQGLRENAREAMSKGYSILVFPGGGREVVKRKGEEYQLIWKERYGFLELAKEYGYDIAPFVALGGDEVYELAYDANVLLTTKWFQKVLTVPWLGKLLRQGEVIPSIPKSLIPKRIPFYFKFLARLRTDELHSITQIKHFRQDLQTQIYTEIEQLKQLRDADLQR